MNRLLTGIVYVLALAFAFPAIVLADICETAWDGDKVAMEIAGRPANLSIRLRDKQQRPTEVTVGQIRAFHEAKSRISQAAGLSPSFIICNGDDPNAFAAPKGGGHVVGVTAGMLRLVNGDPDMAAAVIGHEFAHHTLAHHSASQTRETAIGLLGLVVGIALEAKFQKETGVVSGLGLDLANIGGTLVSRKFDRDQEREADDQAFKYILAAKFNPNGAVRLAERMNQLGSGTVGLFFDTHPGWSERVERFQTMVAENRQAQELLARREVASSNTPSRSVTSQGDVPRDIALAPTYETTNAQRSYTAGIAAARVRDFVTAVREFRSSANAGYAPAQVTVAYLHLNGLGGVSKDEVEAVRLYRLAADQGHAVAQSNLGHMYVQGRGGLTKDEREAVRLFQLSANQGNSYGQANLGHAYLRGAGGLSRDPQEAVRLFRLSAEQGNPLGEANYGAMYLHGWGGLPKDEAEAERLFRRSAEKGNAFGQAQLAVMYRLGVGPVQKDDVEAARLLKLSADQGNALGQANLAVMYIRGEGGIAKDYVEALRLTKLAADQGNPFAQNNLGVMYEHGMAGLPKDVEQAVAWYGRSAAQGYATAEANLRRLGRDVGAAVTR